MNFANLKKVDIVKMSHWKCSHGHTGLSHPNCYMNEKNIKENLAFLDIETSNLNANWGFVFSYCLKSEDGKINISRILTPNEIKNGIYDKELLKQLCIDIRKFDRTCGYYSAHFDIPFLRTRCVYYGLDFPIYKELKHTDLYEMVKRKFKLHSKKLQVVADFFGIKAKEHPMNPSVWFRAMAGDEKALKWILTHNIEDVDTTREVWKRVNMYSRITDTSI